MPRIANHTLAALAALLITLVTIGEAVTVPQAYTGPAVAGPALA